MIGCRKVFREYNAACLPFRIVALDQTGQRLPMYEIENSREDVATSVHG